VADQVARLGAGRGRGGGGRFHRVAPLQQHELEGELERAGLAPHGLRQVQHAGLRVKPAQRFERPDPDADPVGLFQPLGDSVAESGACGGPLGGDPFGQRLEQRKVVGVLLEEVARLLGGQDHATAAGQGDAARVLLRHPPGAVECQHRPRDGGRAAGQRLHVGLGDGVKAEQRVGEHLTQPGLQLALGAAG